LRAPLVRDAYWAAVSVRHLSATVLPEGDDVRDLWVVDDRLTFQSGRRRGARSGRWVRVAGARRLSLAPKHGLFGPEPAIRRLRARSGEPARPPVGRRAPHPRDRLGGALLVGARGNRDAEDPALGLFPTPRDRYFPILDGYTEPNEAVTVAIAQVESAKRTPPGPGQD